jgi:parallel beta-helix repeat protein
MAIRKRSRRSLGAASRKRRTILPLVEGLEQRLVLASAVPVGYTPLQMQTAYGLSTGSAYNNNISFGGIKGDGAGQTIGIYEEYFDPDFAPTSGYGDYSTSALAIFDQTFGLPDPPSLNFFDHLGRPMSASNNPSNNQSDFNVGQGAYAFGEFSMDIEWAHAMAPGASIDVLCVNPAIYGGFPGDRGVPEGMAILAGLPGVSVVSVSWWATVDPAQSIPWDSTILQPAIAAHPNVSFFAASGDYGWVSYPSTSPEVVAVGGTNLSLTSSGQWSNEVAWADGLIENSAGGYSTDFPIPSYQQTDGFAGNNGMRTTPDVSASASFHYPVPVYAPAYLGTATPWGSGGGCSLSAPLWAGMASIADQGRVLAGGQPLGATQMLTDLYSVGRIAPGDFHDITQGTNPFSGYSAGPGYDLVTGLGSPRANLLLPDLAAFGLASKASIVTQPPPSAAAGASFGIIADATSSFGGFDVTYSGTATLSLATGPSGATFTPVTVPVTDGVAIFQNLSLPKKGSGYTFNVTMTGLNSITTSPISVFSPNSGVGYFYPIPVAGSLEAAVAAADSNSDSSNIITLSPSTIPYPATTGQLLVENSSSLNSKSFTIIGQGASSSVITAGSLNRVFEIVGTSSGLSVVIQDLTITGGRATDGGILGGNAALGGGLLIDGGNVALSNCTVSGNLSDRNGGGLANYGTTTLTNCTVSYNSAAYGGGGLCILSGTTVLTGCTVSGNTASSGAGVYAEAAGTTTLTNCTVSGNSAGAGGGVYNGGTTTLTGCTVSGNTAGNNGGGIFNTGTLNVASSKIINNQATSAGGGISTTGGSATITNSFINSNQVNSYGTAQGGGIDSENSTLSLFNCTVFANQANGVDAYGGGIYAAGSAVDLENTNVKGNQANGSVDGEGGGIYAFDNTVFKLVKTNVKGNQATTGYNDIFPAP